MLEFANKKDKSKEGSKIDRENNSDKKNKSKKGSTIDRETTVKIKVIRGLVI